MFATHVTSARTVILLGGLLALLIVSLFGGGPKPLPSFEGQVFVLATGFEAQSCKVFPECDCCAADLYFLQDNRFAYITRCVHGDTYYGGDVQTSTSSVILDFQQVYITEVLNDKLEPVEYKKQDGRVSWMAFTISKCNEAVRLVGVGNVNGSRYESKAEQEMLSELLRSKAWKQLH